MVIFIYVGIYLFLSTYYTVTPSEQVQVFFNFASFRRSTTESMGPQIACNSSETRKVQK